MLNICPPPPRACCDPLLEPGKFGNPFATDGYICCQNGQWGGGIGDGSYACSDESGPEAQGEVCPTECSNGAPNCEEQPPLCTNAPLICDDGRVIEPDPSQQCEYPGSCDALGPCCDPLEEPGRFGNPFTIEGYACCPNGQWAYSLGDGKTFACSDELIENPDGDVCPMLCPDGSE